MKEKHRMKTVSLILCLIGGVAVAQSFKFASFANVNSDTAVPKQFTNTTISAKSVTVLGFKSPQTSNTTTVWIGWQSGNGTQEVPVIPGGSAVFKAVDGQRFANISNFWYDVTTANVGVIVIYE